jgi:hypothetical protein
MSAFFMMAMRMHDRATRYPPEKGLAAGQIAGPEAAVASSSWAALRGELAAWREAGRTPTFWWRDDDATTVTPALERLLALAARHGVPVSLAVIPAHLDPSLGRLLRTAERVEVLQHGWSHDDHGPEGARNTELSDAWPATEADARLTEGRARLRAMFAGLFVPAMVPPWNRIDDGIAGRLGRHGYLAVSGLGPRAGDEPGPQRLNVHLDVMDWGGAPQFRGDGPVLATAVGHLADRRQGLADAEEPTGLMTHHLMHDQAAWDFVDRFLAETRDGGGVWLSTLAALTGGHGEAVG